MPPKGALQGMRHDYEGLLPCSGIAEKLPERLPPLGEAEGTPGVAPHCQTTP